MRFSSYISLPAVLLVAACYGSGAADKATGSTPDPKSKTESADPGDTRPIATDPDKVIALTDLGIDLRRSLDDVMTDAEALDKKENKSREESRVHAIMDSFSKSLGVECSYCHQPKLVDGKPVMKGDRPQLDFKAESAQKNIATRMWNDWVANFKFKDSDDPIFCDSCHQGKAAFLARDDEQKLHTWMKQNFVERLTDADGNGLHCRNCHGEGKKIGEFLDDWKDGADDTPVAAAAEEDEAAADEAQ